MRVDAHHHLWDPARRAQPWMDGPWADPIRRAFTLADLLPELDAHAVDATVVVQACSSYDETRELLRLAGESERVAGVVGWADLTDPGLPAVLDGLRSGPGGRRLVGIRHQVQDEPDADWLGRPEVRRGLAAVAAAGLVYDLLVTPREMPAAMAAVRALPELRFVLDHAGKPPIRQGARRPWDGLLAALAAEPNVTCKLSGLITEADWETWTAARILPYARHVLECFGPERVMAGSDWPVCLLAGDYRRVAELACAAVAPLDGDGRAAVLGGTAVRVYGLHDSPRPAGDTRAG